MTNQNNTNEIQLFCIGLRGDRSILGYKKQKDNYWLII